MGQFYRPQPGPLPGQPETYQQMPPPQESILPQLFDSQRTPNYALMMLGAGMVGNRTNGEAIRNGLTGYVQGQALNRGERSRKALKDYFAQNGDFAGDPALAEAVAADEELGRAVVLEQMKRKMRAKYGSEYGDNAEKFGMGQPLPYRNPETGELEWYAPSNAGNLRLLTPGDGYKPAPDLLYSQRAEGTATGKFEGEANNTAVSDVFAADRALTLANSLLTDPNRQIGTGKSSIFNIIPGSPGKSFQLKVDQATAGAFMSAIDQFQGLGHLSNSEGQTGRDAVTRMHTADTEEGFVQAVKDYMAIVELGKRRAQARMQNQRPTGSQQLLPGQGGGTSSGDGFSIKRLD